MAFLKVVDKITQEVVLELPVEKIEDTRSPEELANSWFRDGEALGCLSGQWSLSETQKKYWAYFNLSKAIDSLWNDQGFKEKFKAQMFKLKYLKPKSLRIL